MKQILTLMAITIFILGSPSLAQQPQRPAPTDGRGDIIMLKEIKIEVAPELPTVVVTIPRQDPTLKPLTLTSPSERLIKPASSLVRPRLSDVKISRIEEPEKILAKGVGN